MANARRRKTSRCRFTDEYGRCRRIATVDGQFCRSCAIILQENLEADHPLADVLERVDRFFSDNNQNEVVRGVTGILEGILAPRLKRQERISREQFDRWQIAAARVLRARQQKGRRRPRPMPPPVRPAPAPPDPALLAREVLGIEADDHLTADLLKQRYRALAAVFHPDKAGGSVARMQKLNRARDVLIRELANNS